MAENKLGCRRLGLLVLQLAWLPVLCGLGSRSLAAAEVEPPDVFARVHLVRAELDSVRWYLGKPEIRQPEIRVSEVAPREVYFQALTLLRKANRLTFEQIREYAQEPETPEGELRPADVLKLVDMALKQIRDVKARRKIERPARPIQRDAGKTPTDVFKSIVQANRQLNLLLEQRMSPSDVYQQVTLCISYASSLLAPFDGDRRLPDPPAFVPGKRPADVHGRLMECFDIVSEIGVQRGLKMLNLEEDRSMAEQAEPSDVLDLASLLVSELLHLHGNEPKATATRPAFFVGGKVPSDVFQRAGILKAQLQTLARLGKSGAK